MRGHDEQTHHMFSYLSSEQSVPADHPLGAVRALTDHALKTMSRLYAGMNAKTGRPSIPREQLLRALLLQEAVHDPERTAADGHAAQLQPAVPLVSSACIRTPRCGIPRGLPRIVTGCWRAIIAAVIVDAVQFPKAG